MREVFILTLLNTVLAWWFIKLPTPLPKGGVLCVVKCIQEVTRLLYFITHRWLYQLGRAFRYFRHTHTVHGSKIKPKSSNRFRRLKRYWQFKRVFYQQRNHSNNMNRYCIYFFFVFLFWYPLVLFSKAQILIYPVRRAFNAHRRELQWTPLRDTAKIL